MSVNSKVRADLKRAVRNGAVNPADQYAVQNFVSERTNYHRSMHKMGGGGRLALFDLLSQLARGPLGVIDFLVFHPIKTLKALLQLAVVAAVLYGAYMVYKG